MSTLIFFSGAIFFDSSHWPLSSPDPETREKAIAYTNEYLQAAHWIAAQTVLVIRAP